MVLAHRTWSIPMILYSFVYITKLYCALLEHWNTIDSNTTVLSDGELSYHWDGSCSICPSLIWTGLVDDWPKIVNAALPQYPTVKFYKVRKNNKTNMAGKDAGKVSKVAEIESQFRSLSEKKAEISASRRLQNLCPNSKFNTQ